MARYFVNPEGIDLVTNRIYIRDDEDIKHIIRVLRLTEGAGITVLDGNGFEYDCTLDWIEKRELVLRINSSLELERESRVEITLFQGISKGERMDYTIQKCAELGVEEIIPVVMGRTVVKFESEKDKAKKRARWEKIAEEASKQSKRAYMMKLGNIIDLKDMANSLEGQGFDLLLLPYELEDSQLGKTMKDYLSALREIENPRIGIVVGPEGGFEDAEVQLVRNAGARVITLGRRILRTETVGAAMASIIQYELGDI